MYLLVEIIFSRTGVGGGGGSLTFASSPRYSLEMCALQESYFLSEIQTENCVPSRTLGIRTKFQLEILTINVISSIIYFREIILESSRNVSETEPMDLRVLKVSSPWLNTFQYATAFSRYNNESTTNLLPRRSHLSP